MTRRYVDVPHTVADWRLVAGSGLSMGKGSTTHRRQAAFGPQTFVSDVSPSEEVLS